MNRYQFTKHLIWASVTCTGLPAASQLSSEWATSCSVLCASISCSGSHTVPVICCRYVMKGAFFRLFAVKYNGPVKYRAVSVCILSCCLTYRATHHPIVIATFHPQSCNCCSFPSCCISFILSLPSPPPPSSTLIPLSLFPSPLLLPSSLLYSSPSLPSSLHVSPPPPSQLSQEDKEETAVLLAMDRRGDGDSDTDSEKSDSEPKGDKRAVNPKLDDPGHELVTDDEMLEL